MNGGAIMQSADLNLLKKKSGEDLQAYLQFKRRGSSVRAKKGKGSFSRKQKYKPDLYYHMPH